MSFESEEARTSGKYGDKITFDVKVLRCDHVGDRGKCSRNFFCGLGYADSLDDETTKEAEALGWIVGPSDYCPHHADLHRDEDDANVEEGICGGCGYSPCGCLTEDAS